MKLQLLRIEVGKHIKNMKTYVCPEVITHCNLTVKLQLLRIEVGKHIKDHMKRFKKLIEMKQLIPYNKMLKTT